MDTLKDIQAEIDRQLTRDYANKLKKSPAQLSSR